MNTVIVPWFHALAVALIAWWFLLRLSAWQRGPQIDWRITTVAGVAAIALCLAPVGGVPWMRWVFGFWANPSLPLLGWVAAAIARQGFGRVVFSQSERRTLAVFGAGVGTVLYLHPYVPGAPDLYALGWDPRFALGGLATVAGLFYVAGSRVGILFLLALIAFGVGALESTNAWDYAVDPVFWFASLFALAKQAAATGKSELGVKN
jgi:hypothetical protein